MNNKRIFLLGLSALFLGFSMAPALSANDAVADVPEEYATYESYAEPSRVKVVDGNDQGRVFGVTGQAKGLRHRTFDFSQRSPFHSGVRSAILPGWGQLFNEQPVKAGLYFFPFVLTVWGSIDRYQEAQDDYDDYRRQGTRNSSLYDDYEKKENQALLLGVAAAVLWGASIYDAHKNAYEPLYSQENSVEFAWAHDGPMMQWKKRFQ